MAKTAIRLFVSVVAIIILASVFLSALPTSALVLPDVDLSVERVVPAVEGGKTASFNIILSNHEAENITVRLFVTGPFINSWSPAYEYYPIIVQAGQDYVVPFTMTPGVNATPATYTYDVKGQIEYTPGQFRDIQPTKLELTVLPEVENVEVGPINITLLLSSQHFSPGDDVTGTLWVANARKIQISKLRITVQLLSINADGKITTAYSNLREEPFSSDPFSMNISVPLDDHIAPGTYIVKVIIVSSETNISGSVQSRITVGSVSNVAKTRSVENNILGRTVKIRVQNNGNVPESGNVTERIPWFERILTSFPAEGKPAVITRADSSFFSGFIMRWDYLNLAPGASVLTPYTYSVSYLPVALIVLLLLLLIVATIQTASPVSVEKTVVKQILGAKSLKAKVALNIRNVSGKDLKEVTLIDYIPALAGPDDFGTIKPANIKKHMGSTVVQWDLSTLKAKEERLITYSLATNYGVLGRVVLPSAVIRFTLPSGKRNSAISNVTECGTESARGKKPR